MGWVPVTDAALADRLRDLGARMFVGHAGTGYGRSDLRMDEHGDLYMLEINPNCGIFYPEREFGSADMILNYDPGGHRGFVAHQLEVAVRRRARAIKPWSLRYDPVRGYGMVATAAIGAGQVIEPWEERPHPLVSRRRVDARWSELQRRWFHQYAWPLTDEIHVMWSDDPAQWRPIDHGCDPNTWLDGLDLVARRPIAAGEALTIDYATFCGEAMAPFDCGCGAAACRRTIRGTDLYLPELDRYGDHLSDYVRTRRRAAADRE
jgi:D-alanine-D-alanine ligase